MSIPVDEFYLSFCTVSSVSLTKLGCNDRSTVLTHTLLTELLQTQTKGVPLEPDSPASSMLIVLLVVIVESAIATR